jgi:thymidylate synthase
MQPYLDLLRRVMDSGNDKGNRTKTWARSVFGHQMRYDLTEGFPTVTTKKLFHRGYIHELLMFIKGETNNQYLLDLDIHIWDGWMVKEDVVEHVELEGHERVSLYVQKTGEARNDVVAKLTRLAMEDALENGLHGKAKADQFLTDAGIPTHKPVVKVKKGELGPVYGQQWRSWKGADGKTYDQLADVIHLLRTNPDSRRMIVSAWNPEHIPSDSVSPQDSVLEGKMALAACHCMFQFYTTPLDRQARLKLFWHDDRYADERRFACDPEEYHYEDIEDFQLDEAGIPTRSLSCQLYQRSCDLFLGVPFNIASYALLTHMLAQVVGMTVGEFVWTGGDCHIYSNHFDQVNEQLTRAPMKLPTLWLNPEIKEIDDFTYEDIRILDYVSHAAIKAPVSV